MDVNCRLLRFGLERRFQQSTDFGSFQVSHVLDADMPRKLTSTLQQPLWVGQAGSLGEHDIDVQLVQGDAADQTLVAAVQAIGDQVGGRVELLDGFGHHSQNQCSRAARQFADGVWIVQ